MIRPPDSYICIEFMKNGWMHRWYAPALNNDNMGTNTAPANTSFSVDAVRRMIFDMNNLAPSKGMRGSSVLMKEINVEKVVVLFANALLI